MLNTKSIWYLIIEAEEETIERAKKMLRMPPVLKTRKEINETLEHDELLDGHDKDNANMVFTDISQNVHNRDRRIVVREPNGILRQANWHERDKMNQIYFPVKGRKLHMPPLFLSENLQVVFAEGRHEYILDLINVQCDPDSEDYIRVHHETYEDIDKRRCYDVLYSTRHFGGMVYYLVKNQRIDHLLLNILEADRYKMYKSKPYCFKDCRLFCFVILCCRMDDVERLIKLCHILHPNTESASQCKQKAVSGMDLIEVSNNLQTDRQTLE
jgi:small subunit ribosomal protein S22